MTGGEEPVLLYQDTRRKNKDSRAMLEMAEELTAKLARAGRVILPAFLLLLKGED